jgi:hypothetical protein
VDDFNDGNDDGWDRFDPIAQSGLGGIATFSIPGGDTYRIQTEPSPAPGTVGPGRAGAIRSDIVYTDFHVSVDIVDWDPALSQVFGIIARLNNVGFGQTDGYAFTYDITTGDLDMTSFTGEDPDGGGFPYSGIDNVTLVRGNRYRMVCTGVGQELTAAIYAPPDLENTIARIVGTDGRYSSGTVGLLNYDITGSSRTDVTYDNFAALVNPAPLLSAGYVPETGELALIWPTNSVWFILQSSPSLTSPVWSDISPPYQIAADIFLYLAPTGDGPERYFRLATD